MFSSFQLAKKYLDYYRNASNSQGHGMHSPFVFDFILNVLNNKSGYQPPAAIEILRSKLLADRTVLPLTDLGAGSRKGAAAQKQVRQLARTALKPKKYAQLLYRLACHYKPKEVVELGTSLGITTAYLAAAAPSSHVITIEGSEAVAERADSNFRELQLKNIHGITGDFDSVLPGVLQQLDRIDLGYIDGNHRYEPTISYFRQFLEKKNDYTILVFDDIHWSAEMERAWEEIRQHPEVQYTIDIFFLGFVFFRKEFRVKQHFSIRF